MTTCSEDVKESAFGMLEMPRRHSRELRNPRVLATLGAGVLWLGAFLGRGGSRVRRYCGWRPLRRLTNDHATSPQGLPNIAR
jgi:hypothetical protein